MDEKSFEQNTRNGLLDVQERMSGVPSSSSVSSETMRLRVKLMDNSEHRVESTKQVRPGLIQTL